MAFPLYGKYLRSEGKRIGFVFFDFGRGGFQLILWGVIVLGLVAYGILAGDLTVGFVLRWGIASFVVVLVLSIDIAGSTPVYKGSLHDDRFLRVVIDENRCKGSAFCEQVCPRNTYELDKNRHIATMPRANQCIRCGACIVQCPFDALYFESPKGETISAETVRRFKLNLLGKRLINVAGNRSD